MPTRDGLSPASSKPGNVYELILANQMTIAGAKSSARSLVQVVEEFRKYDPKMELGQLLIYLLIAAKPGIKTAELVSATGLTSSAVSRNILSLTAKSYLKGGDGKSLRGHNLVTQATAPFDKRAKLVTLTRSGQILATKIAQMLPDNNPSHPNGADGGDRTRTA